MKTSLIEETSCDGFEFLLMRTENPQGKNCFTAKAALSDGEIILLDHWNLSVLKKRIQEWVPLIKQARQIKAGFYSNN